MRQVIAHAINCDGPETCLTMASAYGARGWCIGEDVRVVAPDGTPRETVPGLPLHVLMADGRSGVVIVSGYVSCLATGDVLERVGEP